jgi:hypothetical protein
MTASSQRSAAAYLQGDPQPLQSLDPQLAVLKIAL